MQNSEIMTVEYLKTLVFGKFFKKLQHNLIFLFLKSIISDNSPPPLLLYDYSTLSPHIQLFPIHFRKTDMTTKNSGGFIRSPPPLFRGDDAMFMYLVVCNFINTMWQQCRLHINNNF